MGSRIEQARTGVKTYVGSRTESDGRLVNFLRYHAIIVYGNRGNNNIKIFLFSRQFPFPLLFSKPHLTLLILSLTHKHTPLTAAAAAAAAEGKCFIRIHSWQGRGRWALFGARPICSTSSRSLTTSLQTSPPPSVSNWCPSLWMVLIFDSIVLKIEQIKKRACKHRFLIRGFQLKTFQSWWEAVLLVLWSIRRSWDAPCS